MKNIYPSRFLLLLLLVLGLLARTAHAQIIVIANPAVAPESVSKSELRDVFTGVSSSIHGARVHPVLLKEGPVHAQFVSTVLDKPPIAFILAWRSLVLSGQAVMPKTFESEPALVEYVSHTPNAIGYVSTVTPHDSVKVLTVR